MKTPIIATALFAATAAAIALYPAAPSNGSTPTPPRVSIPVAAQHPQTRPKIEVVFVLDTTGSMGGMIQAAKDKIWSIASTMAQANPTPELRVGLVAFRDRGDSYITQLTDLSGDLDTLYGTLMDYTADGGGDGPESVNQALYDAVHRISWSQDPNTYRVVFLVGDAPPHMDYQDDVKYPVTLADARAKGIVVNAIQCGHDGSTLTPWRDIAALGSGKYFDVEQAGSAVAIATPFDDKLAVLSNQLDGTRLYYGDREDKAKQAAKIAATEKLEAAASPASKARRGVFNSSVGAASFLGKGELVDDVSNGRIAIDKIPTAELPATIQAMEPAQRIAVIAESAKRREQLKTEMQDLARQRDAFIKDEVKKAGGAEKSLDTQLFNAVKEQAGAAGIVYKTDAPSY